MQHVQKASGIVFGIRQHLAWSSFRHLTDDPASAIGLVDIGTSSKVLCPLSFRDVVAVEWEVSRVSLLVSGACLAVSVGLDSPCNISKLLAIPALMHIHAGPWVVMGDSNATPLELEAWIRKWN
eukprot:8711878-Pyramimonas_sp.AAC.1